MTTICLSMIVKNEAHVIRRGLDTVKPFIHYWVIVDTGSTDGTQDIIREHMKDIPGELIERPWKNFAHNRNEAIEFAVGRTDYLMFLDADEEFVTPAGWRMPQLTGDAYRVQVVEPTDITYDRISLVPTRQPWRYVGVMHEVIECHQPHSPLRLLEDVFIGSKHEGARSLDPQKGAKDAAVLEAALKDDPYNSRYVFYLAQSYRGMHEWRKALEAYQRRTTMDGYDQECYCAWFYAAVCAHELQLDESTVMTAYLRAYQYRPRRAESLYELARYCRMRELWSLAYLFAKEAAAIPHPGVDERIFVYETVYSWRALDEWEVAASWTGRWLETKEICERLLAGSALPACERGRVQRNLKLACARLGLPAISAQAA
jgi:glycosyltransferase involved in cell wall biosynthesis